MEGVTAEHAHWTPPGTANPLGATYARAVMIVDGMVNGMIAGAEPLFMSANVGISEPPPGPDPDNPGFPDWGPWGRRVQVDMAAMREYAQAVYAASTVIANTQWHTGEISCLKGLQGAKGYPF